MAAADVIDAYLAALPGETRRLERAQWGVTVQAEHGGGWPLDVGIRISDGLVRVQAYAVPADAAPPAQVLLHWNRQTRLVRFATTRGGDVWIHADAPVTGLDEGAVDRLLGLVAQAAVAARQVGAAAAGADEPPRGWDAARTS